MSGVSLTLFELSILCIKLTSTFECVNCNGICLIKIKGNRKVEVKNFHLKTKNKDHERSITDINYGFKKWGSHGATAVDSLSFQQSVNITSIQWMDLMLKTANI